MNEEVKSKGKDILAQMKKLVTRNEDLTLDVKMPEGIENYTIKELTIREEQSAKKLATADIPEEEMCMIRSIKHPEVTTDSWPNLPAKVKKRLTYVQRYLDGDFDFLE